MDNSKSIEQIITEQGILDIAHPNMSTLFDENQVAFAMVRRSGLGASDASVYLGVNIFTTVDQLIAEKKSVGYTDREKEISEKENVRRGRDLEPLILKKFEDKFNTIVDKPKPMYRIKAYPQLTINYDGLGIFNDRLIPIEAKYVSPFGNKYYDRSKCVNSLFSGNPQLCGGATLKEHIEEEAALYGIPPYYYTQIQQQMMGVNAPFAYLAVLFDKGWDLGVYRIFSDEVVWNAIIRDSELVWKKVTQ